jgi:hypothetical protein
MIKKARQSLLFEKRNRIGKRSEEAEGEKKIPMKKRGDLARVSLAGYGCS